MQSTATDESDALHPWRHFWYPVCTAAELRNAKPGGRGPLEVHLLGQKLVVAELAGTVVAMQSRCAHRSASLSLGCIEDNGIRCAYHG